MPNPDRVSLLSVYNNNIQLTDIEVFSKFINLIALKIGTEQSALKKGKLNNFYGSSRPYQKLVKPTSVCIETTDVNEGLEYLPASLADSTFERPREDIDEGGYQKIECRPHNANVKCSVIKNQLRPYNYDLEAWQLHHLEKMLQVRPWLFDRLDTKEKWVGKLERKVITTKQEIRETEVNSNIHLFLWVLSLNH